MLGKHIGNFSKFYFFFTYSWLLHYRSSSQDPITFVWSSPSPLFIGYALILVRGYTLILIRQLCPRHCLLIIPSHLFIAVKAPLRSCLLGL